MKITIETEAADELELDTTGADKDGEAPRDSKLALRAQDKEAK